MGLSIIMSMVAELVAADMPIPINTSLVELTPLFQASRYIMTETSAAPSKAATGSHLMLSVPEK
ncbi:hypothetical protein D3C80_2032720 [compost metagenome]